MSSNMKHFLEDAHVVGQWTKKVPYKFGHGHIVYKMHELQNSKIKKM